MICRSRRAGLGTTSRAQVAGRKGGRGAGIVVLLGFLLPAAAAWAQNPAWKNTWKTKDPSILEHLLLEISEVTREGFAVSFDEGIGAEGNRGRGQARLLGHSKGVATIDIAGRPCELSLALKGRDLHASGCALGAFDARTEHVLIPESAPRYFVAGFNCARARGTVARTICSDRALAGLDKSLSEAYGKLRVKLSKADQNRLRADQREWLIGRDADCGPREQTDDRVSCLKRHYGARLFGLRAWREYRVRLTGAPDFAAVREVAEAAQAAGMPVPNLMEMGIAAWLNAYVSPPVLETDRFERYEASADSGHIVVLGTLVPNPGPRHADVRPAGRRVILLYHAGSGLWFGDIRQAPTVYAQPNRTLADAPQELLAWLGGFAVEEVALKNVLP